MWTIAALAGAVITCYGAVWPVAPIPAPYLSTCCGAAWSVCLPVWRCVGLFERVCLADILIGAVWTYHGTVWPAIAQLGYIFAIVTLFGLAVTLTDELTPPYLACLDLLWRFIGLPLPNLTLF